MGRRSCEGDIDDLSGHIITKNNRENKMKQFCCILLILFMFSDCGRSQTVEPWQTPVFKVLGKSDRIYQDHRESWVLTKLFWKSGNSAFINSEKKVIISNKKKRTSEDYKTRDEIVNKYGMYDSINVKQIYVPKKIKDFLCWNSLGISALVTNDTLWYFYIAVTEYDSTWRFSPANTPDPKGADKGKYTLDGKTIDLIKKTTDSRIEDTKTLGMSSLDHAPAGDSKAWGRELNTGCFYIEKRVDEAFMTGSLTRITFGVSPFFQIHPCYYIEKDAIITYQ